MQLLPAIRCAAARQRLPLSDATAVRLANALLSAGAAQRHRLVAEALAEDPALALWIVAGAWSQHGEEIRTLARAAHWMTLPRWAALADELQPAGAIDPAQQAGWSRLLCASLHALPAEALDSQDALAKLLHNARQWLGTGGDEGVEDALPPWLAARQREIAADEGNAAAPEVVRRWSAAIPCAGELLCKAAQQAISAHRQQRTADEARLREKLASLKEFTYGASHELNNPLFNISSRAQVLMRDEGDPARRKKLATIYSHAMRASEMISDMALAARPPVPQFAEVDIAAVARGVIEELSSHAAQGGARVELEIADEAALLTADAAQLAVVIRELAINAVEAIGRTEHAGQVRVGVAAQADHVMIVVADDGPGLDERARRHLFDPFFSGYESGRGFGFGLTKAWQIVQAHHGQIEVHSTPGQGTSVTVRLPRRPAI